MNTSELIAKLQSKGNVQVIIFDKTNNTNVELVDVYYSEEAGPSMVISVNHPDSNIITGLPPDGMDYINRRESGVNIDSNK